MFAMKEGMSAKLHTVTHSWKTLSFCGGFFAMTRKRTPTLKPMPTQLLAKGIFSANE